MSILYDRLNPSWDARHSMDWLIEITDGSGPHPSQHRPAQEFDPYQRFCLSHIVLAIRDWNNLQTIGHVTLTTGGDGKWTQQDEDAMFLFLCDDSYGKGEPDFITLAMCCNEIGISVEDVRAKLVGYGEYGEPLYEWECLKW